jgi:hypothetical protein
MLVIGISGKKGSKENQNRHGRMRYQLAWEAHMADGYLMDRKLRKLKTFWVEEIYRYKEKHY